MFLIYYYDRAIKILLEVLVAEALVDNMDYWPEWSRHYLYIRGKVF